MLFSAWMPRPMSIFSIQGRARTMCLRTSYERSLPAWPILTMRYGNIFVQRCSSALKDKISPILIRILGIISWCWTVLRHPWVTQQRAMNCYWKFPTEWLKTSRLPWMCQHMMTKNLLWIFVTLFVRQLVTVRGWCTWNITSFYFLTNQAREDCL